MRIKATAERKRRIKAQQLFICCQGEMTTDQKVEAASVGLREAEAAGDVALAFYWSRAFSQAKQEAGR